MNLKLEEYRIAVWRHLKNVYEDVKNVPVLEVVEEHEKVIGEVLDYYEFLVEKQKRGNPRNFVRNE